MKGISKKGNKLGRKEKDFSVKTSKVYLYLPNRVLMDYKSDRIKEIIVGLSEGKYRLINYRVLDVPVTEKDAFFVEPWKDLSPADNESVIKVECPEPKNIVPVKAKFVLESDTDDSDYSKNNLDHRGKSCVEWVIALMGDASTDVQVKIDLYKHIEKLYESFSSRDFS